MNPQFEEQDPSRPAAYDADGQPLYTVPPESSTASYAKDNIGLQSSHVTNVPKEIPGENYNPQIRKEIGNEPHVVHTSRDPNAEPFEISDAIREKHEASKQKYPNVNLSHGEFVILDIKRHPIGLLAPLLSGGIVLLVLAALLIIYPSVPTIPGMPSFLQATFIIAMLMILVGIGVFIAVWVYLQNQFFLTNEGVIQEMQASLFSHKEQMVSLGSIEDASYSQKGVLQTLLNYGVIRLSLEGDETAYQFTYVHDPRGQIAIVNDAIEAFKNGRPFES